MITFNNPRTPAHIYTRTNAGVFSADLAGVASFDYFPNTITVGDAIYFSCVHAGLPGSGIAQKDLGQFRNITLNVGTALAAVGLTLTWEYFTDIASGGDGMTFNYANTYWKTLTVDNTNPFTTTGTKTVSFAPPKDWINSYYSNPVIGNQYNAWVRCRVTAVTSSTEGGANATTAVTVGDNTITVTGAYETGTATAGAALTLTQTGKSWTTDAYKNRIVSIISGTGAGQYRKILSNTANTLTVDYAWATNPDSTSAYVIKYNFDDVWAAHNAGSWGVITNPAMNFFILEHVALNAGDNGTTPGYLEIRNYTIRLQNWRLCGGVLSSKNTSILQLGYKNSQGFGVEAPIIEPLPSADNTEHGVCLNNINCHDTATMRLLGSIFRHPKQQSAALGSNSYVGYGGVQTYFYMTSNIEEVDHTYDYCVALSDSPTTYFTRVNLKNAAYGFRTLADIPATFADIAFTGQVSQLFYLGNTSSVTFKNPIVSANNNPTQAILFSEVPSFDGAGGMNTLNLLNSARTDFNSWSANALGTINYSYDGDVNVKVAGSNFAGAKVGFWDAQNNNVTWVTTDANGNIATQQLYLKTQTHTAGSGATRTTVDKTPHKYKIMHYGYKIVSDSKTASASFKDSKTLEVDPYVTLTEANANAVTGISINWATKVITVSGTRSINDLYDYCKAQNVASAANAFYDQPVITSDGINFALNGYTLTITGALTGLTKVLTGTKTISTGGYFEDSTGAIINPSGTLLYLTNISHVTKVGGVGTANIRIAYVDSNNVNRTYNASRTAVSNLNSGTGGVITGYVLWKSGTTVYTGHKAIVREYEYQLADYPTTVNGTPISSDISVVADPFVVATEAVAGAISGITINYTSLLATISGNVTIQNYYDFVKYNHIQPTNYDKPALPLQTSNGSTFQHYTNWNLTVTGTLVELAKTITYTGTGALTTSGSGFFEDSTKAQWASSGVVRKASHFYTNVKAITGGTNISNALVSYINSAGTDVTFNASRVAGAFTTDASGNAEGYVVYQTDASINNSVTQLIGEFNYQWSSIPKTITGSPIGSSSAYETVRLVTDTQVTLTKANALAVTGIVVTAGSTNVELGSNLMTNVYDNLKARQAQTAVIETGVNGYMNYYSYGLLVSKDSTTYTLKTGWEFDHFNTSETGRFRNGRLSFATPGTYSLKFQDNTFDFEAAGTYDFRNANIIGTVNLVNTSGGNVTVKLHPDHLYTNTGPNITVEASVAITIQVNGMTPNSRYQLYDVTNSVELINTIDADGSATYNYTYSSPTTIRLRVMYVSGTSAKQWYEVTGLTSANGLTFNVNQSDNLVYSDNNIDGSTVTTCSVTGTTIRIYVDEADNTISAQEIYNWYQYFLSTALGIANQDGDYITSTDQTHYTFNNDMRIVNQDTASPLSITGANIVPDSGIATNVFDVSNGASIILNFNRVEGFPYSVSGTVNVWHEPPTAVQVRTEIDTNSTKLASILEDTGTTLPAQISGISGGGATKEEIRQEMDNNSTKLKKILNNTY